MIVYRPTEIMDLILELLDGMRSYTRNVDLGSAASCKYPAIRQPSHRHHFLERDGDLIVESFLKYSNLIPEFLTSMRYYTVIWSYKAPEIP